eukprot:g60782.t1
MKMMSSAPWGIAKKTPSSVYKQSSVSPLPAKYSAKILEIDRGSVKELVKSISERPVTYRQKGSKDIVCYVETQDGTRGDVRQTEEALKRFGGNRQPSGRAFRASLRVRVTGLRSLPADLCRQWLRAHRRYGHRRRILNYLVRHGTAAGAATPRCLCVATSISASTIRLGGSLDKSLNLSRVESIPSKMRVGGRAYRQGRWKPIYQCHLQQESQLGESERQLNSYKEFPTFVFSDQSVRCLAEKVRPSLETESKRSNKGVEGSNASRRVWQLVWAGLPLLEGASQIRPYLLNESYDSRRDRHDDDQSESQLPVRGYDIHVMNRMPGPETFLLRTRKLGHRGWLELLPTDTLGTAQELIGKNVWPRLKDFVLSLELPNGTLTTPACNARTLQDLGWQPGTCAIVDILETGIPVVVYGALEGKWEGKVDDVQDLSFVKQVPFFDGGSC